jgi:hypothetical protein
MCEFQAGDRVRRIHYCRHSFHEESFLSWFQNHVRCPVCRHDIREHAAPPATNQLNDSDDDDGDNDDDRDDDSQGNGITGSYTVHDPTTAPNPQSTTTIPINNNNNNNNNQTSMNSLGNSLEILLRAALAIDPSNNNRTDLQQYLRSAIDISNTPVLTFEFPIEYEEYYDSSDNLLGRGFMGRR